MNDIETSRFKVEPGIRVQLSDYSPSDTSLMSDEAKAEDETRISLKRLAALQNRFYAEHQRSLLIVLQGMDASGKDGTIKNVMLGVNPQGCSVASFKVPAGEELAHNFLWRIERAMPRKGHIVVFNRSHYEDVLAARVHNFVPREIWKDRYDQINRFEQLQSDLGTVILKFFLHISKEEQKKRFEERLSSPEKNWKFDVHDLQSRLLWDEFQTAYEDVVNNCSTNPAPWYIVPADHKWFRNWMIASTIVNRLEGLNPQYPPPKVDVSNIRIE